MALRAFLCWVLATAVVTGSTRAVPRRARRPRRVQGVRRDPRRRRPAAGPPQLHAGQGERPDLAGRDRRRHRVGPAGRAGVDVRAGVVAALRVRCCSWSPRSCAILLPAQGRLQPGRGRAGARAGPTGTRRQPARPQAARARIPSAVAFALRANCGPRWLSGFLIMFMAFLLRENPIGDWSTEAAARHRHRRGRPRQHPRHRRRRRCCSQLNPPVLVVLALVADAVMVLVAALFYGVVALALLGLTAGLAQSLAKLALDATIQRDVPERVQSSAFARSDTTLQLAWVIGGFVGIAMPLIPRLGLGHRGRGAGRVVRVRDADAPGGARAARERSLELQLVGQRAQQLGRGLGGAGVGVAAVPVALADAVEQADQVLDDRRPSPPASCGARAAGCARPRRAPRGSAPGGPGHRAGPGRCRTRPGCRP